MSVPDGLQAGAVATRVRWLAVRGIAAVVTGTVVLGVGGRLVMLVSRLLHPDAVGHLTEGGNRIGAFTIGGTVELVVFGGVLSGVSAGFVWVATKRWLPAQTWLIGAAVVAIGGQQLVRADNRDFTILAPAGVDVALLLGLLFAFGALLPVTDAWLERRLPPASSRRTTALYALPVVWVAPLIVPVSGTFVSRGFCFCERPPVVVGAGLAVAAVASAWWWVSAARGADAPRDVVVRVGQAGTAVAVVAGLVGLTREVLWIV